MEFLLKSSLLIGLLYCFYKVFLQKETFFRSIRIYFVIGLLVTVILPLLVIPIYIETVQPETPIVVMEEFLTNSAISDQNSYVETSEPFNWMGLVSTIYIIGVLFFTLKFLLEIVSLYKLIHESKKLKEGKITFAETIRSVSPFSIFTYIVYNKQQFKNEELAQIIAHEKVHVDHLHTYDMLLVHILVILQWFNPFAWLYKKDVQQNLEFLADKYAQEKLSNTKEYQYLLLKTSITNTPFTLSTNFYNSLIKKRIIMLQKDPSKKFNQLKYILLLPLIAVFLYAFNTKEVIKPQEALFPNLLFEESADIEFINPVKKEDIKRIGAGYGKMKTPDLKQTKLHKGIDIIAPKGTKVYATANGKITNATYHNLKGNYITIDHKEDYQTNYFHLDKIKVTSGKEVKSGELIGTIGTTGKSTGPHLHYEILKNGKNINPRPYIIARTNVKKGPQMAYLFAEDKVSNEKNDNKEVIKIGINKDTTKEQLEKIKKELKGEGVTVNFKKVKRNNDNEITSISITASTKNSKVSYKADNDKEGIKDIVIEINDGNISIGNSNSNDFHFSHSGDDGNVFVVKKRTDHKTNSFHFSTDDDIHMKHGKHKIIRIEKDSDDGEDRNVFIIDGEDDENAFVIKKADGTVKVITDKDDKHMKHSNVFILDGDDDKHTTYIVNGKKMSKEEFEKMDKNDIKTIDIRSEKDSGHKGKKIKIITDVDDYDEERDGKKEIKKRIKIISSGDGDSNSFFYEIEDGDDDENTTTIYKVNGKEMSKEEFEKFDKSKIKDMEVRKEKKVIKKRLKKDSDSDSDE